MSQGFKLGSTVVGFTFLAFLLGCAPPTKKLKVASFVADVSELELDRSYAPTLVYVRPEAPSLATYHRFIIDPVSVAYDDPAMDELNPEQVGEMQQYFQGAMLSELRKAGYVVGTRSQANTLRISSTISDLKAAPTTATPLASAFAVSVGEVKVTAVFRDAVTDRVNAVAIERSRDSQVQTAKPWSSWADVKATFDGWAKRFREAVDEAHGR